jgi:hypothetical protein
MTQVQRATGEAVETLRAVMQNTEAPASARVSAAKRLETAVKAVELEAPGKPALPPPKHKDSPYELSPSRHPCGPPRSPAPGCG